MKIINTTPHEIRFQGADGSIFVVPPCGTVINAVPREVPVEQRGDITLVRTAFVADAANLAKLDKLEEEFPGCLVVGSIIAAQAFPGRVLALTPAPGYERVPIAEKLISATKFTIF